MAKRFAPLIILMLLSGCLIPDANGQEPEPPVDPPGVSPAEDLQELVSPLKGIITGSDHALLAARFYQDFADVVERDDDVIKTTGVLRDGFIRSEKLMLQKTDMVGKYPGFGAAKDKIMQDALGLDNVALTPEKRKRAVEVLRAIAWAIDG